MFPHMNDETLAGQIRQIMADTFGIDEDDLPDNPSHATVARWTSVLQMVLLVALEDQFQVSFSMSEMSSMTSLDQIVAVVRQKTAAGRPA
jgi:acyl carrier protein